MIDLTGCVLDRGQNVFALQVRVILQDLFEAGARAKKVQNICDPNSHSTNARTPAALLVVDRNSRHAILGHANSFVAPFYRSSHVSRFEQPHRKLSQKMPPPNRYPSMYPNSKTLPAALGLLLASLPLTFGTLQAQSQTPPAFEVASVKEDKSHQWVRRPWSPNVDCGPVAKCGLFGNRFSDQVASLDDLLMDAYSVKRFQISGLPAWGDTGTDVYDVEATIGGDRAPTLDEARVMLQTLLAERFQLKIHRETRELPVYALVVAKNGPKLKPSDTPCNFPPPPNGVQRRTRRRSDSISDLPFVQSHQ